jgi:hypothetical protein
MYSKEGREKKKVTEQIQYREASNGFPCKDSEPLFK